MKKTLAIESTSAGSILRRLAEAAKRSEIMRKTREESQTGRVYNRNMTPGEREVSEPLELYLSFPKPEVEIVETFQSLSTLKLPTVPLPKHQVEADLARWQREEPLAPPRSRGNLSQRSGASPYVTMGGEVNYLEMVWKRRMKTNQIILTSAGDDPYTGEPRREATRPCGV
jgi:hypothetical protein